MNTDKSKRFQIPQRKAYQPELFSSRSFLQKNISDAFRQIPWELLFRRLLAALWRLLVAVKYQLLRLFPGLGRLPWLKLAVATLVVFVVFRRDLQFQVNLSSPSMHIADDDERRNDGQQLSTGSLLQPVAAKTPVDPFADAKGDTEDDRQAKSYIRRFQKVAVTEMEKFGIPASVKMAQALIESDAGNSRLASKNNNHFGIKCFSKSCRKGHCSNFSDDHHKDFFRIYDSAWESWRAHSEMLATGRYKELLKNKNDYRAWAKGLKSLGYATDPNYERKLVETIEKYHLQVLDR